jgi:hypothetical protein
VVCCGVVEARRRKARGRVGAGERGRKRLLRRFEINPECCRVEYECEPWTTTSARTSPRTQPSAVAVAAAVPYPPRCDGQRQPRRTPRQRPQVLSIPRLSWPNPRPGRRQYVPHTAPPSSPHADHVISLSVVRVKHDGNEKAIAATSLTVAVRCFEVRQGRFGQSTRCLAEFPHSRSHCPHMLLDRAWSLIQTTRSTGG